MPTPPREIAAPFNSTMIMFCLVIAGPACVPQKSELGVVELTAMPPSQRLAAAETPLREREIFSQIANQISLFGAVNETLAFQLDLRCRSYSGGVALELTDLVSASGTIAWSNVESFVQAPVTVSPLPAWLLREEGPGNHVDVFDVLIPVNSNRFGGLIPVSSAETTRVWVDCRIPREAAPGEYESFLVLKDGAFEVARTVVKLRVHPFVMPDTRHVSILAGVDALSIIRQAHAEVADSNAALSGLLGDGLKNDSRSAVNEVMKLFERHRLTPFLRDLTPRMQYGSDGNVRIDWSGYDDVATAFLDGSAFGDGIPLTYWPLPINDRNPPMSSLGGMTSPVYARVRHQYLQECMRHFKERGWPCAVFTELLSDWEPVPNAEDHERIRRLGAMNRHVSESILNVVNVLPGSLEPYGWPNCPFTAPGDAASVWAPPPQFFLTGALSDFRRLGSRTWIAPDRPPFSGAVSIESRPGDVLALGCQAFTYGSDIFLHHANQWRAAASSDIGIAPNVSSDWLVYPGSLVGVDGVVPSVRLKQLRAAAQFHEYLWLLKSNGREGVAQLIAGSLARGIGSDVYVDHYADGAMGRVVTDSGMWELARRLAARELDSAVAGAQTLPSDTLDSQIEWTRFISGTRQVVATCESIRLRPVGSGWEADFNVDVENRLRLPMGGTLSFGELPAGWEAVRDHVPLNDLPEAGRARIQVTARLADLPVTVDGHISVPLQLVLRNNEIVEIFAVASVLTAERPAHPVSVDGEFDEWELGRSNVATSFALIGRPLAPTESMLAANSTEHTTIGFVSRDAQNVYLAIRCNQPDSTNESGPASQSGNQVRYDDLIPVGEDLVEVLLDPSGNGSDSYDLLHMVFKRNGIMRSEQGIGMEPPIGLRRPWGQDVEYAIKRGTGFWQVEVRIPMESLGPEARQNLVWGINLCRFEKAIGAYSNWSGAVRYCYNPRSLGNMAWRP